MKQIGEELGVQSLVEGSVRKVGDQLRVIVQLINAKTDEHIWKKRMTAK
jgi:adenylate cyclase